MIHGAPPLELTKHCYVVELMLETSLYSYYKSHEGINAHASFS